MADLRAHVLDDIVVERERQDEKWGEQNHPDGTGPGVLFLRNPDMTHAEAEVIFGTRCRTNTPAEDNWRDILMEEVAEAFAEDDPFKLRKELVQVAAVAAQWIEAIDRRETTCRCTRETRCGEAPDERGCVACRRLDIYEPCPNLGFLCGEGRTAADRCDCCTDEQWAAAGGEV